MTKFSSFHQTPPELLNPWASDPVLRRALKARIPESLWPGVEAELARFAVRVQGEIEALGAQAEREVPELIQYDAWGQRVDEIRVSSAWSRLDAISAEEGLVAIGHERKFGEHSRLIQFAKLYLFHPASAFYSCPLAMTDGAARVLELHGSDDLKATARASLISRDPKKFWTSGQWMTERSGGSDVSRTSVTARNEGGSWRLYGDKWFTSATTSQMALVLARVESADGDSAESLKAGESDGLALFFVKLRDDSGRLQEIQVNRLKNKLGTKALPTAELSLTGTPATMIGKPGEGVKKVASLLNITRLYNSVCCAGAMARGLQLSIDYTSKRIAFGRPLSEQPLHLESMADLKAKQAACAELLFHCVSLLGKEETGAASADEVFELRILTPIVKLFTAREAISNASETIEAFGGAGYIEDTGIPKLLRDAQVFPIWEGTTNVLSLDTFRAMQKEQAYPALVKSVNERLKALPPNFTKARLERRMAAISHHLKKKSTAPVEERTRSARKVALGLAETVAGSLLLERTQNDSDPIAFSIASRFAGLIGEWVAPDDEVGAMKLTGVKEMALEGGTED